MSKRYGRNQKRKARAQIEALTKANQQLKSDNWQLRELTETARRIVNLVRRVCPNSVALQNPGVVQQDVRQIAIMSDLNMPNMDRVSLYDLEIDCRSLEFQSCVEFIVRFDGNYAGHRFSKIGFEMADEDYLVHSAAKQMIRLLRQQRGE